MKVQQGGTPGVVALHVCMQRTSFDGLHTVPWDWYFALYFEDIDYVLGLCSCSELTLDGLV